MSKTVVAKDKDGKDLTIIVRKPKPSDYNKANMAANAVFGRLVSQKDENGHPVFLLRNQINDLVRERGLWDDTKEKEYQDTLGKISKLRRKLVAGGIKLSEGRKLAMEIRDEVFKLRQFESVRNSLDSICVESRVENERLSHLVIQCVFYDDGRPVYNSVEEYHNASPESWTNDVAKAVTEVIFGVNSDELDKSLPENKFLLKHNFANTDGRFTRREDGKLVDEDGRLIDETGRYVNDAGQYVDRDGNLVDSDGFPLVENPQPFLDDDGNPIL